MGGNLSGHESYYGCQTAHGDSAQPQPSDDGPLAGNAWQCQRGAQRGGRAKACERTLAQVASPEHGEQGAKFSAQELHHQNQCWVAERDRLLEEVATLRSQLAVAERQVASDPSRIGGSYAESCAIPTELQDACHQAYSSLNLLCNKVASMLWDVLSCRGPVESYLLGVLGVSHHASRVGEGNKKFVRLALMGFVSRIAFASFEAESFTMRGASCMTADRKERADIFRTKYGALQELGRALEEETDFQRWRLFLWQRLSGQLQLSAPGNHVLSCIKGHWDSFKDATHSIWHLHVLAFAFEVPPELIWREAGNMADAACIEFDDDDFGQGSTPRGQVAFTIFPGFRLGGAHTLLKCKVMLLSALQAPLARPHDRITYSQRGQSEPLSPLQAARGAAEALPGTMRQNSTKQSKSQNRHLASVRLTSQVLGLQWGPIQGFRGGGPRADMSAARQKGVRSAVFPEKTCGWWTL
eukprot:jgi/Mesvir1/7928/Mv11850-RA.1